MWKRVLVVSCLFASAAYGVTIGELHPGSSNTFSGVPGSPFTVIAFSRPALAAGTVDRATVMWNGAAAGGCASVFKLKFFRRSGSNGTINVTAERGPFNVVNGPNHVTFAAVPIEINDLIGVTSIVTTCGGVAEAHIDAGTIVGTTFTDPTTTATNVNVAGGYSPNVIARSTADFVSGYIVAAGSLRGSFGAQFKTSVQLVNLGGSTITGKLVFHPAGVPAQASDPSVAYSLGSFKAVSYDDVVQAAGASGLGTMDVVVTSGYPPDVNVRIFNDEGTGGTSGLTEEALSPRAAFRTSELGSLNIPADLTNFRLNVGWRTLDAAAHVNVNVFDKEGVLLPGTASRDFPANTFNQETGAQFANTASLPPGGTIVFHVTSGSVFVYGAVTDNRTNDPNLRFALRR